MKRFLAVLTMVAFLGLAGCGKPTKQDLLKKAEKVETAAELEKKLGKPDDVNGVDVGIIKAETWTYKAKDGKVVFTIIGDKVTIKAAGRDDEKE